MAVRAGPGFAWEQITMTRDEIDVLWLKALGESVEKGEMFTRYRFAALVAAYERRACADVCEGHYDTAQAADAIRARGNA